MADSKQLYQEVILDHNRKPRNWGVLPDASHRAEGHNPLCGDHLTVTLRLRDDGVDAVSFQGESCAICKASASMMTQVVKGKPRAEIDTLRGRFREMVMGQDGAAADKSLGSLRALSGVARFPARVKCALLAWNALDEALAGKG